MKIRMTSDFRVAEDGFTVQTWTAETIHDTSEQLAKDLIDAGVAEAFKEVSLAPAARETRSLGGNRK